jgi:hypothetical protein
MLFVAFGFNLLWSASNNFIYWKQLLQVHALTCPSIARICLLDTFYFHAGCKPYLGYLLFLLSSQFYFKEMCSSIFSNTVELSALSIHLWWFVLFLLPTVISLLYVVVALRLLVSYIMVHYGLCCTYLYCWRFHEEGNSRLAVCFFLWRCCSTETSFSCFLTRNPVSHPSAGLFFWLSYDFSTGCEQFVL